MDQLRTLLAVHEEGTALGAARLLGREQSSIQKQLDTMNRNLGELCGEPLVRKRGRGERVQFTVAGEALADVARGTLGEWLEGLRNARAGQGRTLAVGSTRYTLGYLLNAVERVSDQFTRGGVELRMAHVRTGSLLAKLRSGELDLVCGSVVTRDAAEDDPLDGIEVMEWRRSGLALVTNLDETELPARPMTVRALATSPLVVSADGLISDFLRGWFGDGYRERMEIAAEIDSVPYGFELLRSGVLRASMLVTEGIGEAVSEGWMTEAHGLRTLRLVEDVGPRQRVLVGAFTRRGARADLGSAHPLNQLWSALIREDVRWRASALEPAALGAASAVVRASAGPHRPAGVPAADTLDAGGDARPGGTSER
ncbi:LysR family transcriptional regulator [Streptomyces sp. AJS327]|nr:LysR family transcriptional regulator [Streptomyces sp. AJS327]